MISEKAAVFGEPQKLPSLNPEIGKYDLRKFKKSLHHLHCRNTEPPIIVAMCFRSKIHRYFLVKSKLHQPVVYLAAFRSKSQFGVSRKTLKKIRIFLPWLKERLSKSCAFQNCFLCWKRLGFYISGWLGFPKKNWIMNLSRPNSGPRD